jgi:Ca2+/Na+ antiporter
MVFTLLIMYIFIIFLIVGSTIIFYQILYPAKKYNNLNEKQIKSWINIKNTFQICIIIIFATTFFLIPTDFSSKENQLEFIIQLLIIITLVCIYTFILKILKINKDNYNQ